MFSPDSLLSLLGLGLCMPSNGIFYSCCSAPCSTLLWFFGMCCQPFFSAHLPQLSLPQGWLMCAYPSALCSSSLPYLSIYHEPFLHHTYFSCNFIFICASVGVLFFSLEYRLHECGDFDLFGYYWSPQCPAQCY